MSFSTAVRRDYGGGGVSEIWGTSVVVIVVEAFAFGAYEVYPR